MTDQPGAPSIGEIWGLAHLTWIQLETMIGIPQEELKREWDELGFIRSGRARNWDAGPCAGRCGEVHHFDELDEDFRCPSCARSRGTDYAWGEEPPPRHRHWLELEKIGSAYRRDRREGRLRTDHHEERRQTA